MYNFRPGATIAGITLSEAEAEYLTWLVSVTDLSIDPQSAAKIIERRRRENLEGFIPPRPVLRSNYYGPTRPLPRRGGPFPGARPGVWVTYTDNGRTYENLRIHSSEDAVEAIRTLRPNQSIAYVRHGMGLDDEIQDWSSRDEDEELLNL